MLLKSIFIGALVLASGAFGENLTDKLSSKSQETAQVRANVLKGKASFSEPWCGNGGDGPMCGGHPCAGEAAPCQYSD